MKRLIIICEGPTEKEFCNDVLLSLFMANNIHLQTPLIKKSGGGIVPWKMLKTQIETHLKQDSAATVTTLIDYYGIEPKHKFPGWEKPEHHFLKRPRNVNKLEAAMKTDVEDGLSTRFIPYVQMHEFEGLLFNNLEVFTQNFTREELKNRKALEKIFREYPNPEDINDHPNTAPSKRLEKLIGGYSKVVYGSLLAQEIGLKRIREKSPRFNAWITQLESL